MIHKASGFIFWRFFFMLNGAGNIPAVCFVLKKAVDSFRAFCYLFNDFIFYRIGSKINGKSS